MLNVVMQNVVMLSVLAPAIQLSTLKRHFERDSYKMQWINRIRRNNKVIQDFIGKQWHPLFRSLHHLLFDFWSETDYFHCTVSSIRDWFCLIGLTKLVFLNTDQFKIIDKNQLSPTAIVLNELQKNIWFVKITKSKKKIALVPGIGLGHRPSSWRRCQIERLKFWPN